VHQLRDGLNNWLLTQGGAAAAGLRLDYDPDGISALSLRREQLWDKLNKATFLSEDEKRQAAGYGHHGKGTAVRGGGSKFCRAGVIP
jgi:phage portal protein BeeE